MTYDFLYYQLYIWAWLTNNFWYGNKLAKSWDSTTEPRILTVRFTTEIFTAVAYVKVLAGKVFLHSRLHLKFESIAIYSMQATYFEFIKFLTVYSIFLK